MALHKTPWEIDREWHEGKWELAALGDILELLTRQAGIGAEDTEAEPQERVISARSLPGFPATTMQQLFASGEDD